MLISESTEYDDGNALAFYPIRHRSYSAPPEEVTELLLMVQRDD